MTPLRFLFDRCCPRRLAWVIAALDETNTIRFFDDDARFVKNTSDQEGINVLAADPPWCVVSMDAKILTRPHERAALHGSGLKFFLLGKGWMSYSLHNQAWRLVKTWHNVVEAAHNARGDIFEVSSGSSLKVEPKRG